MKSYIAARLAGQDAKIASGVSQYLSGHYMFYIVDETQKQYGDYEAARLF